MLLPEGFPLLPLDFGRAGGVEEPLVARSVHGSSLLSPRFIRGLGIQELLSGGELLLPVLSRLAFPPQLCTLGEVLGRESFRGRSLLVVFGARELASVSSVHSWTRDSGVALWRQTPATCSVPVASPTSSLHAQRGGGAGESPECRSS